MKIHAIKSLNSSEIGLSELVETIIDLLNTLFMNYLPREVKMFVKNCDITAHQYNQRTLIGPSDSILGFSVKRFGNMNIDNYQVNQEWEGWIARQQKTEPESSAAMYTSSEDEEKGYDNNHISSALQHRLELKLPEPGHETVNR